MLIPAFFGRAISATAAFTLLGASVLSAQTTSSAQTAAELLKPVTQVDRVSAHADFTSRSQLANQLPKWVKASSQSATSVDLSDSMQVTVGLKRSDEAEAAFEQLLSDQQNTSSPLYHHWLTGNQIGQLYGPTDDDMAAIESWAASEGLTVKSVAATRISVELTGSASAIASAFRTSFANFDVNGESRLSAISEPSIPTALSGVIDHVNGLTQVVHAPAHYSHTATVAAASSSSGSSLSPMLTASDGTHYLVPADFNTIYGITSVLSGGNTGAKVGSATQRIAIIARSRVDTTDIQRFDAIAGLTYVAPTVTLAGTDPGLTNDGNQDEATLDVNRVQGTATGAIANLVVAASTKNLDGVYIASNYVVNTMNASTLTDQIMTLSFGSCEVSAGASDTATYNNLFKAAAAEGVSVFVSSGDSGANGCYSAGDKAVTGTASMNDLCGQYVTCVGGTQFIDTSNSSTYWSSSNSSSNYSSALSYIPEGVWNEPTDSGQYVMAASGGAPSIYLSKPSWQTGTGVPSTATMRMTPDVAFSSAGHDGYLSCLRYSSSNSCVSTSSGTSFVVFSGTSAAAPSMAGIAALLNTSIGSAQGLLNPLLYTLAQSSYYSAAFHDVTPTTSGIGSSCTANYVSVCNNSTPSSTGLTVSSSAGVVGYTVNTGYDQATGLGSLNVANFIADAPYASTISTSIALTASATTFGLGSSTTLTATLTPASTGSSAATGTVTFYANGTSIGQGTLSNNTATLTYTPTATGTYALTATYGGDSNYGSSTTTTSVTIVVSSDFTITPALTVLPSSGTLVSGTTVTDAITVTSLATYAGTVPLSCTVAAASTSTADTAAAAGASCSVSPTSVALTAGGSALATLSIASTPGTAGNITVTVSSTISSGTVNSVPVAVTLTAASFRLVSDPSSLSLIVGNSGSSSITITSVNGFVGTVSSLACTASTSSGTATGTCSISPSTVTLTSGGTATATLSVTASSGSGVVKVALTGTGTTSGASASYTGSCTTAGTSCVAVTVNPNLSLAASPSSLSFTSGATTGNTSVITLTAATGVSGTATVACSLSSSTATYQPSCSLSSSSVTLASGGTGTTTMTIASQTAVTSASRSTATAGFSGWRFGALGVGFIALLALRKRRQLVSLTLLALLALGASAMTGCGGDSAPRSTKSSAGSYTATITATLNGQSVSTTVAVTID